MKNIPQEIHGFHSRYIRARDTSIASVTPRLYSPQRERVCLEFLPLRPVNRDPKWEDWHCYNSILTVFKEDYRQLLLPYFDRLFPIANPINGEMQDNLDECFDNWIGKDAWAKWIAFIQEELSQKTIQEQVFYCEVLAWIEAALAQTNVIVVDGNL